MMFEPKGRIRRRSALVGIAACALLVWGCEGNHAFQPVEQGPEITDLLYPSPVASGDSISVGVRALGLVRVDSIIATLRIGSYEQRKAATQAGIQSDFAAVFGFRVPAAISDTLASIEAYAIDAQRNVGPLTAATIRTIDTAPPLVGVTVPGTQIGLGTEVPVTVTAQDNISLTQIGFRVVDSGAEIIEEVLLPADGQNVTRTILFEVPSDLPLGGVSLFGIAIDREGNTSTSDPVSITLTDVDVPEVEVVVPDEGAFVPAQDSVFTAVRIRDNDAVDSVRIEGVEHRGDPGLGTDEVVVRFQPRTVTFDPPVADTLLQRFLVPSTDSTAADAYIRAIAYDREGNISRDSVRVSLFIDDAPPYAVIEEPTEGEVRGIGNQILVRTLIGEFQGEEIRSGVETLTLEGVAFRGDPELGTDTVVARFEPRTVTFDPPQVENMLVSRFLTPTADNTSEYVHIIATATDAWGNQQADTVRIKLVNDTIPPAIIIHEPDPGTGITAGDSVHVSTTVFEGSGFDESGVARVRMDGVAYRFNPVFGTTEQISKFETRRFDYIPSEDDVNLSVYLQPAIDTTPEDVWIRVFGQDEFGNSSVDSVMVTLNP